MRLGNEPTVTPARVADEQEFISASRFEFDKDLNHSLIAAPVELTHDVGADIRRGPQHPQQVPTGTRCSSAISLLIRLPRRAVRWGRPPPP